MLAAAMLQGKRGVARERAQLNESREIEL
jgi:hypothetical protein